ncbi:MAG: UDP-N-acetylglucosamine--N-acetylmuramyl-(pentapeptide) pyrophosphoryl-undecaprenol N-acetylglucosamine transferase [Acidimicrobiia bacterium]|nr:UDP-N-acetylglucosamine--N-acetylmuramyl-(pentapeptide) pyrophosphoryl-undecaprenol N-acetylglucosamine transferase [Acidimicrobiia bacterium]
MTATGCRGPAWAVIAGGGTGGHIYPGLAVAEALADAGRAELHFVVSRRRLDSEVVAAAGFAATGICARGFQRRIAAANLRAACALACGVWQCWGVLARTSPKVVLAQGGYVSAACAIAARLRGVPVVVLEANAVAGAANRLSARWAKACATAFDGTALAGAVRTGLPVRAAIARMHPDSPQGTAGGEARSAARAALGVAESRRLVLVTGGSQGSRRLNAAVDGACALLEDRSEVTVRHLVGQAGANQAPSPEAQDPHRGLHYQRLAYEHDMPAALAASDLVVSRAGGSALAESAAAGRAAVVVPMAGASADHQVANAAALAAAGAAVVIPESELDGQRLATEITDILGDPARLEAMQAAAARFAQPDAAGRVAALLIAAAGEGSPP